MVDSAVGSIIILPDRYPLSHGLLERYIHPYYGLEHLVPEKYLNLVINYLRIFHSFVEYGRERFYARSVIYLYLDKFNHTKQLSYSHERKCAHIYRDNDKFGGAQGVECQESEAGRTVDDYIIVIELIYGQGFVKFRNGVVGVFKLLLDGAEQNVR